MRKKIITMAVTLLLLGLLSAAALEMGDRDGAFVYARELEGGIEHVLERQTLSWQNLL